MKKAKLLILISSMTALVIAPFTNCSGVDFQESGEAGIAQQLTTENREDGGENAGNVLTPEEIKEVIGQLPLNPPLIPVTAVITDPSLLQTYKCPNSDGVVICHFPNTADGQSTQCIGVPALDTHYDHVREMMTDIGVVKMSDYLGPCRN